MRKHRILIGGLTIALLATGVFSFAACDPSSAGPPELTFLKTEGEKVKNASGEEIYLRGVNVGGLFVTEHWMTGFQYTTPSNDYKSLTETFLDRFGEERTKALWTEYRANWWTEQDFKNCADMGMNVLRLPFTYMNVDFAAITSYEHAGESYDFSALDAFVEGAAKHGMYTILDLHGAYGSQNGQDHSGEIIENASDVRFFYDSGMQGLTVKLWSALSEHYKDNPYVAGYDILNEPGEKAGLTSERHWLVYDKIYRAIRGTGDQHIVMFESCWDGEDLPLPSRYGWENCMYSFHHYSNNNKDDEANILAHGESWNEKIEGITEQNFGVPIYMGEFTSYTSEGKWDYTLDFLNRLNWHWTSWTYKVWGNMPWGIVNIRGSAADKVDAMTDEYEVILGKFKILRTNSESARKYTFSATGNTLEGVFKKYTVAPAIEEKLEEGDYLFDTDYGYLDYAGGMMSAVDHGLGKMLEVAYHPSGDGSVYLRNDQYVCVLSSGVKYLTMRPLSSTTDSAARFYPVRCGEGWAFVSRGACKYLSVTPSGLLVANASTIEEAAIFYTV